MTRYRHDLDEPNVIVLDEPPVRTWRAKRLLQAPSLAITRPHLVSAVLIGAIIALHAGGLVVLAHATRVSASAAASPEPTLTAYILPKIVDTSGKHLPDLSTLVVQLTPHFTDLHIEQPQIEFEVERNDAALSAAPSLIGRTQMDMSPYVREASLLPGGGVTVVLRIEVLEDGTPGRIQVDTSGGTRQIDQAAIDYARTRHWNPGRIGGAAHVVWIRWGVRLQA
jgi:TonB family protein